VKLQSVYLPKDTFAYEKRLIIFCFIGILEAGVGIEPAYTALQAAA
jgi:hypothetical protein